jgi:hypothetical protein
MKPRGRSWRIDPLGTGIRLARDEWAEWRDERLQLTMKLIAETRERIEASRRLLARTKPRSPRMASD